MSSRVLHVQPHSRSIMPQLLNRVSRLPAHHAVDEEPIKHGHIYVAPPDLHLLLEPERVRLLPAGMLILEEISDRLGRPLTIGRGGLREGVILELLTAAERKR